MCALFAATYADRAAGLVMIGSYARRIWTPDHPWGPSADDYAQLIEMIERDWGGPVWLEKRAPNPMNDGAFCRWGSRFQRLSARPGPALALTPMDRALDLPPLLPPFLLPPLLPPALCARPPP